MRLISGFLVVLLTCPCFAQDIDFPDAPTPPTPAPVPGQAIKVSGAALYVGQADVPVLVVPVPAHLVRVTELQGPVLIRSVFADGTGRLETRRFEKKTVYSVEAAGKGRVELLVIPVGAKTSADIVRRTLDVDSGIGPQPPPEPPVPPGPTPPVPPEPTPPTPPAPIPGDGFRVLFVIETADVSKLPKEQLTILTAKSIRDYLNAKCVKVGNQPEYRIWDKDIDVTHAGPIWQQAMQRPRQSLPWLIISDGKTGYEGPLPKTVDETLALLKKYGGA